MVELTEDLIREYLGKNKLMVVATYGSEHPWIAAVYYSFDEDLTLYFLSAPTTFHCRQIEENPQVAVSIVDSTQKVTEEKKGLQIYGVAEQVSSTKKIQHALRSWRDALNVTGTEITYEAMMKDVIKGRMYKIAPKKIKFFNQELFPVEDGEEPVLLLED